jgi:peptidoglycan/xylan/chitin deacetylase (PgdA/CDA1 family)
MSLVTPIAAFTYAHYRYILQSALDSDYTFISFPDLKDLQLEEQLVCLLRHDCDNDLKAAVAIARMEEEMGVRSTYFLMLRSALYNLLSIPSAEMVREIIARGHWIGLHFDEHYYPDASPVQLAACVDRERSWLCDEFGVPVEVVSFHQPSWRILDKQVKIGCVNTYDLSQLHDVYYLSDSNTVWKEGCPSEFFRARRHRRLQLLLHPEWWTAEQLTIQEKWNQMLSNNFELIQQSLLTRERVYVHEQAIEFRTS